MDAMRKVPSVECRFEEMVMALSKPGTIEFVQRRWARLRKLGAITPLIAPDGRCRIAQQRCKERLIIYISPLI